VKSQIEVRKHHLDDPLWQSKCCVHI